MSAPTSPIAADKSRGEAPDASQAMSRATHAYCRADAGARHVGVPKTKRSIAAASTEPTLAIGSFGQAQRTILCFGRSITRHDPAARLADELLWWSLTLVETGVEDDACEPDSAIAALSVTSTLNNTRTVAALLANGETR